MTQDPAVRDDKMIPALDLGSLPKGVENSSKDCGSISPPTAEPRLKPKIASVALDLRLDRPLDYNIPPELQSSLVVGAYVEVPLKHSLKKGFVVELKERSLFPSLKDISKVLVETPLLTPDLLSLALFMAEYYCSPVSAVLKTMLPQSVRGKVQHKEQYLVTRGKTREEIAVLLQQIRQRAPQQAEILDVMLKAQGSLLLTELLEKSKASRQAVAGLVKKNILSIAKMRLDRSPLQNEEYFPSKPKVLSPDQAAAYSKIAASISEKRFETHLLFGVTGSGKTEVYLQAIAKSLENNSGTIMLVPEISLTTQTIERFRSRFEGQIAVLHHRLSLGEKHDEWKRIHRGEAKIVIGARSAIFSPVQNLGLIIVDEEHESSYKQSDSMPAYHARDAAVMRGKICQATVVLGSATPSLESLYNAQKGKYSLSKLTTRPEHAHLPHVTIVDMKKEYDKKKGLTIFSEALLNGIEKRYKQGEQTILFLNRRGFHSMMLCTACGESIKCPSCDLSLTFHKGENCLTCHLCGFGYQPPPKNCPACKSDSTMKFRGIGTEQVESALYAIFPEIRVMRLDADSTKHKGSHHKLYRSFRTGKADILVGTQMIAKGLHFPEVTLVGILNSDISLNIPDFRASETTFQLLTQVAGRSGRGVLPGEVLIQTCIPDNSVIQHASRQDLDSFAAEELEVRKLFRYPPFAQLAKIRFSGKQLPETREAAENFRLQLTRELPPDYELSPVQAAGYAKIKEYYRLQFFIKGQKISPICQALKKTEAVFPLPRSVNRFFDINPVSTYF